MDLRRPASRRAALAGLVLLLAASTTACSDGIGKTAPAATVNGTEITQDEVVELTNATRRFYEFSIKQGQDASGELAAIVDSMGGTGTDTVGLDGADQILAGLIQDEVIRQELARHDALPTDEDRKALRDSIKSSLEQQGGEITYDDLDPTYMANYVNQAALTQAYQKWLAAEVDKKAEKLTPEERATQMQALYEQLAPELPLCLNAILTNTEAEASDALARVQGGEDFATVAQATSIDPASAEAGGFAGCESYETASQAFGLDFTGAEVGELFGPAEYFTQEGGVPQYVVIEIAGTDGPTYEQLEPRLESQVPEEPPATDPTSVDAATPLRKLMRDANIDVDPRFGTWNGKTLNVDPPPSPPKLETTTTSTIPILTTAPADSGG